MDSDHIRRKIIIYLEHACLSNRSPVSAMDEKAIDQACDVTC